MENKEQFLKDLKEGDFYYIYTPSDPFVVEKGDEVYGIYMSAGHTYCIDNFFGEQVANLNTPEEVVSFIFD